MHLLSGTSLRNATTSVLREQSVSCAVAFWGKGAEASIGARQNRDIRLICNLKMGGTNPEVIERLIDSGMSVRQSDRLHAKVYIGKEKAVVTSANASINGLGLEGEEVSGWIETGVEIPAHEALPWFNETWNRSRLITPQDIEDARRIFRERAIMKPTRISFADFHPKKDDFPLISWFRNEDWDYNDREIAKSLGAVSKTVHKQIDFGLDVEVPEDVAVFRRGLWVLHWQAKADGMPSQRCGSWWTCSSGIHVPNAFRYKSEKKSMGVVLSMHPMPPQPFDISEGQFHDAFKNVMSMPEFSSLREQDYKGSFFSAKRQELVFQFWMDLRKQYDADKV
jgi:hypothetical protein